MEEITFSYRSDFDGDVSECLKVISSEDAVTIDDALTAFEDFLRGAGFVPRGPVVILDEEEL